MSSVELLQTWLNKLPPEPVLLPELPIVDPHHHLWDRGGHRYLHADFLRDAEDGHRIESTVYVECQSGYRTSGPSELRPLGETEFVVSEVTEAASLGKRSNMAAAIVSYADLSLGRAVEPVLEAHRARAKGRLRGIRYATAWDPSQAVHSSYGTREGMLRESKTREGLAMLANYGLCYDAWVYFPQLDELAEAADSAPAITFVIDHLGGPIGIGPYAGRREELFAQWRAALARLAQRPNVRIKLGGLGMALMGYGFRKFRGPPSSEALATLWRPYIETAIELFGVERAMFESNFPLDLSSCSYRTLWNSFKIVTSDASDSERNALFANTALDTYRLERFPFTPNHMQTSWTN
jgi:L-fuconolactonase